MLHYKHDHFEGIFSYIYGKIIPHFFIRFYSYKNKSRSNNICCSKKSIFGNGSRNKYSFTLREWSLKDMPTTVWSVSIGKFSLIFLSILTTNFCQYWVSVNQNWAKSFANSTRISKSDQYTSLRSQNTIVNSGKLCETWWMCPSSSVYFSA